MSDDEHTDTDAIDLVRKWANEYAPDLLMDKRWKLAKAIDFLMCSRLAEAEARVKNQRRALRHLNRRIRDLYAMGKPNRKTLGDFWSDERAKHLLDWQPNEAGFTALERLRKERDEALARVKEVETENEGLEAHMIGWKEEAKDVGAYAARLKDALEELVAAKDEKDKHGKSPIYFLLRDEGWRLAREALALDVPRAVRIAEKKDRVVEAAHRVCHDVSVLHTGDDSEESEALCGNLTRSNRTLRRELDDLEREEKGANQ